MDNFALLKYTIYCSISSFYRLISINSSYFCYRNFSDAEELLTKALTKTEEHFGLFISNSLLNFFFLSVCVFCFSSFLFCFDLLHSLLMNQSTGSHHPKVGVVLTCIGLMFRWKAMKERSSSLLVQEVSDIKNHNFDYFTILQYQMAEDLEKSNHYSVGFTQNLIVFLIFAGAF